MKSFLAKQTSVRRASPFASGAGPARRVFASMGDVVAHESATERRERLKALRAVADAKGAEASTATPSAEMEKTKLANPFPETKPSPAATNTGGFYSNPMAAYEAPRDTNIVQKISRPGPSTGLPPPPPVTGGGRFEFGTHSGRFPPPPAIPAGGNFPPPPPETYGQTVTRPNAGGGYGDRRGGGGYGDRNGGRGRGNSNNSHPQGRGMKRERNGDDAVAYYSKSMTEDPWRFLVPGGGGR